MKSTFHLSCLKTKTWQWQVLADNGGTMTVVGQFNKGGLLPGIASMIDSGLRVTDAPAGLSPHHNGHPFKLTLVLGETEKDTLVLHDLKREKKAVFTPEAECSVDNSIAGCARWAADMIVKAITK